MSVTARSAVRATSGASTKRRSPDAVLITIPDADADRLDGLVRACELERVACRFVRRQIDLEPSAILITARK